MAKVRDLPDCERNGLTVSTVGLFQVFVSDSGRDIAICFATDNLADSQLEALASGLCVIAGIKQPQFGRFCSCEMAIGGDAVRTL